MILWRKWKSHPEWENFANHVSDPGLFAEYVKNSFTIQLKENPIKIWTTHKKILQRIFVQ